MVQHASEPVDWAGVLIRQGDSGYWYARRADTDTWSGPFLRAEALTFIEDDKETYADGNR